jgi:hypothetical protein
MPESMNLIIPKIIRGEDIPGVLASVYDKYKGSLLKNPFVTIIQKEDMPAVKLEPDVNFSELGKYMRDSEMIDFDFKQNSIINFDIWQPPIHTGYPKIRFELQYIYASTEVEAKEAKSRLNELLGFAKLLMKYSKARYFYGGVEAFGDAADRDNEDIALICGPWDVIVEKIHDFIKNHSQIDLSRAETIGVIEKSTKLRVKEDGGCELLFFFEIKPKGVTYDNKGNPLLRIANSMKKNPEERGK